MTTDYDGFFDSVGHDRIYAAKVMSDMFNGFFTSGYASGVSDELLVTEGSPAAMKVLISAGFAAVYGRFWYVDPADSPFEVTISAADPTNPRIDRICLRLDLDNRWVIPFVRAGAPAGSPVADPIDRSLAAGSGSIYEICLAEVLVGAGVTSIVNANITDTRNDPALCGAASPRGAQMFPIERKLLAVDSATIDFSAIPATYRSLRLEMQLRCDRAATFDFGNLIVNGDTGANYDLEQLSALDTALAGAGGGGAAGVSIGKIPGSTAPAGNAGMLIVEIPNYKSTTFRKQMLIRAFSAIGTANADQGSYWLGASWRNTAAINQLTLRLATGGAEYIAGCEGTLYGIL
jgi:hypothetical protein